MPATRTALAIAAPATAALIAAASWLAPARATPAQISLLQTLEAWKYPGSTMLGGASMADGGNPRIPDVICQAVLTTPDPVEDVARFYARKLAEAGDPQAVATQDDTEGRPVAVRVLSIQRADTSTTLVITRAEGDRATHVAWSHYIRLPDPR